MRLSDLSAQRTAHELASGKVEVQHAEAQALRESQAGAVERRRDEQTPGIATVQLAEHGAAAAPPEFNG